MGKISGNDVASVDAFGDYAVTQVPKEQLKSPFGLFLVFTGVLVCIAVIWGGGSLGNSLSFKDMALAAVAGSLILGVIGFLTATIGGYTRASTYVILRHPFGRIGSMIAGAAVSGVACGIGWFFIQSWLFATVLQTIVTEIFGYVPFWAKAPVSAFWGALMMTISAAFGYKGIAFLSYLAVPLFLIALGGGSYAAISEAGGFAAALRAHPSGSMTLPAAITAVVGMYVAGATITSDISRYSERPTDGAWAWFWQVVLLQPILMLAGGTLTLLTPASDVAKAMAHLGIGLGALVLIVFGQWTTNDNNLYNGALAFANTFRARKTYVTIAMGFIGAILASLTAAGVFGPDPFISFLNQLGRFLPPIAGVLIADFYIYRPFFGGVKDPYQRYTFGPGTEYTKYNAAGLVAWAIAGWLSPHIGGITALNSILLGFGGYLVLSVAGDLLKVSTRFGRYIESADGF
ncbi:MAG: cytosine permease [Bacillota bacterium]|nr:cytosine permease [Bacillota bacterium]MDI6638667.1 cytosine permease [Bacillota bacterium]MDK2931851.1 cytosine permease [Bacillota bacterium]